MHLAREAGLEAWLSGALSDERFAARLARVWAGLPGDHSNRSVYAGIQGNRATIAWPSLVASLRHIEYRKHKRPVSQIAQVSIGRLAAVNAAFEGIST